jgi:hypothetical protein
VLTRSSYKGWKMPLSPNVGTPGNVVKLIDYYSFVKNSGYAPQLLHLYIHLHNLS